MSGALYRSSQSWAERSAACLALVCPLVEGERVCLRKGYENVELGREQVEEGSEAEQDGRYEPHTTSRPPSHLESRIRLEPLYQCGV
jgi:hypothetical protein